MLLMSVADDLLFLEIYSGVVANIYLAERGARAYNGGLGAEPPTGSRGKAPLKLKSCYVLDMQWKQQTCLTALCILETE